MPSSIKRHNHINNRSITIVVVTVSISRISSAIITITVVAMCTLRFISSMIIVIISVCLFSIYEVCTMHSSCSCTQNICCHHLVSFPHFPWKTTVCAVCHARNVHDGRKFIHCCLPTPKLVETEDHGVVDWKSYCDIITAILTSTRKLHMSEGTFLEINKWPDVKNSPSTKNKMNITTTAEESVTLLEIWTFCDIRISTLENVCSPLNVNQWELIDTYNRIYTVYTRQKVKYSNRKE